MATKSTDDFDFVSYKQEQVRLDGDAVKGLLGRLKDDGKITESEYMGCFKEIQFDVLKTVRKDPSKKLKFTPPDLRNATIPGLIDMLAEVRERNAVGKKEEGYYKERLVSELVAAGEFIPSPAPEMPEWLKAKIAAGGYSDDE